jgi:creatinine amidohydrolase
MEVPIEGSAGRSKTELGSSRSVLLFRELTRGALSELCPRALVVLPVGAIEQHGPHLPVGTDSLIVEHVAHGAAARAAGEVPVLLAPTLSFGSSHHHLPWTGALSLSSAAFLEAASDLVSSLCTGGFRRIFLLNGHGGNEELLQVVARDTALEQPVHLAAGAYWTIAREALARHEAVDTQLVPGHAGYFETSIVLALRPDLVGDPPSRGEIPSPEPSYRLESDGAWERIEGWTDSPKEASAAQGETILEVIITEVAAALVDFYRRTEAAT